ncbi:P-loop NTPase fold protein [Tamlana sp. 2_MG-2023]|uniref:P-loop NTPase fold protein n=1 Tax=unclassified Tamlana TaxID=2614803 RepID=UPI0026E3149A|nr:MULTISPECIES: P-loop NTPase fold protein [unclassified Tamlana]MDO6759519.1 P-loop NTPase fold protein [Tamlana sp. 2_MG-2023]MDO6790342.1 P-loop NTPase fold protein [Tamlana sp. 1_MG-2023]
MSVKYNFIDNKPIGKDLFEGKSQERIANVIIDIVKDNKFKVIGIDGGWGTGKSNLVKIVDDQLPNHKFFVYDVWGHQEDEQRKAILVELTDFITDTKKPLVANKNEWKDKLKKLLAKEKEVTTINRPYLSVGFILSLLAIIYIPTINTFIRKSNGFESLEKDWWRILVILLPILLVVIIYFWKVGYHLFVRNEKWSSFKIAMEQTFQVYTNKQEEETKIETISENQPSVREFRKWMKDIDKDLKGNKLVLVFDNFDRLPKKHILSIWSVIHVFFAETEYENIKIIIPFDRIHIKNAFKDLNGEAKDYANDYINKTFDIVYRVAPPILSSWKVFFKDNWKTAFLDFNETEYIKTEQAYEIFRPDITPREIIAFINEVVSIKLLDDSIPDRYIAVFVLNEEEIIQNPLKAVTDLSYLKGMEYLFIDDGDFQKYITALAYQIEPDNSLEIVYRKQLKDSLANGDEVILKELSKTKVFSRILKPIIDDIEDFNKPIETLKFIDDDSLISELELQDIWNDIYLKIDSSKFIPGELEDYKFTLLDKINDEHKSNWLKIIVNQLYTSDEAFNTANFSESIDKLDNFSKEKNIDVDVFSHLKVKSVTIEQLKLLIDKKEGKFEKYKINCLKANIEKYLTSITVTNLDEANFINHLKNKTEFSKFHELLKTFVPSNAANSNILKEIYRLLKATSNEPIPNILTDAQVYTLMNGAKIGDDFYSDLACMRILFNSSSHPSYAAVYNKALDSEDTEFHKKVSDKIEHYISLKDLLINSIRFQNNLIKAIIPLILSKNNENRIFDSKMIIKKLIDICNANEIETETLFREIDKHKLEEYDFEFAFGLSIEFYRAAKESNSIIANQIIQIFIKHFKNANAEDWSAAFENLSGKQIEILQIIEFKDWNSFALEKFKSKLVQIVSDSDNENLDKILPLTASFEDSGTNLVNTFKDLRDLFIKNNNISKEHFINFIELLIKYGSLVDRSADVLRTLFKTEFLDDENCVKLMASQSKEIKALIDKVKKSESSDFINGIKDRGTIKIIEELANSLSIKIPKPKADDKEKE